MRLALLALLFAAAACSSHHGNGPCSGANPDPACSQTCGGDNPCPAGFFCADDGTCNAECTPDGTGCADNEHCSTDGHCDPNIDADCPDVTLNGTHTAPPTPPAVELVLDQSGSMTTAFGSSPSRYAAMRDALVGTGGIVTQTHDPVVFGAPLYPRP